MNAVTSMTIHDFIDNGCQSLISYTLHAELITGHEIGLGNRVVYVLFSNILLMA